jgi:hypothetical protein
MGSNKVLDEIVALFEEEQESVSRFEGLITNVRMSHDFNFEVRGDHVIVPEYCYIMGPGLGEALRNADGEPMQRYWTI